METTRRKEVMVFIPGNRVRNEFVDEGRNLMLHKSSEQLQTLA